MQFGLYSNKGIVSIFDGLIYNATIVSIIHKPLFIEEFMYHPQFEARLVLRPSSRPCRIEDDVIVTATGIEVMSIVPRTVEEIEAWMRGEGGEIESIAKHK